MIWSIFSVEELVTLGGLVFLSIFIDIRLCILIYIIFYLGLVYFKNNYRVVSKLKYLDDSSDDDEDDETSDEEENIDETGTGIKDKQGTRAQIEVEPETKSE